LKKTREVQMVDISSLTKKLFSRTHDQHMPKQVPQGREHSAQ